VGVGERVHRREEGLSLPFGSSLAATAAANVNIPGGGGGVHQRGNRCTRQHHLGGTCGGSCRNVDGTIVIAIVVAVVPVIVVREVHAAGAVARPLGVRQRRNGDKDNNAASAQLGGAGTPLVRPGKQ
jgi:hypothetical protein